MRRSQQDRAAEILEAAVAYFTEAGFGGTTRELARRIGVSQSLLYRYFPTKETLLDRVYEEVFGRTWKPEWDLLLDERNATAATVTAFYADYATAILKPRWIRLFLLSGLHGNAYPSRWIGMLRSRVFPRVIAAVRRDMGLMPTAASDMELEAVWGLHGSLVYLGVRRSVFGMAWSLPMETLVEQQVTMFMAGLRSLLASAGGISIEQETDPGPDTEEIMASAITMRELQKISASGISSLPHTVPIRNGQKTVGFLVPLRKAPPGPIERAAGTPADEAAISEALRDSGAE